MQSKNVLITVIVILALLNGYFSCHNRSLNKKNIALEAEKNKLDSLYTSVSSELKIAELTLDSLRGKNAEMDSIITIREKELAETKLEIESLLKKNKLSLAELAGIKKLVKTLQEENDKYFKDINQMNQKINALTASNDSLKNYLESEISNNEKLTAEKKILGKKAELGALLKPENITGTGIKIDSKNSESETNSAKKSQKIKVCFDVPFNRVADAGPKEILVRILNPSGSTLSVESQGSGTFKNLETNETTSYTSSAKFDYNKTKTNVCTSWSQNTAFSKGTYKVLFYQNGYFLTESNFTLK